MSIVNPTPSSRNLGTRSLKVLKMPSVRLRILIQTWMCPMSPLRPKINQQLSPSFRRVWRTCLLKMQLWKMPPSIFRVTVMLPLKVKRKLLRRVPVTLKMYMLWRRTMPRPFNSRLFYFYFFLCKDFGEQLISDFNRCPLYLNFSPLMGFNQYLLNYPPIFV